MSLNKKTNLIFKKIENTRKLNNSNWMELLKIAYTSNPKETTKILKRILQKDEALIKLAKFLTKKK
jgi:midasin (ATPase involved in ribosome maturation)